MGIALTPKESASPEVPLEGEIIYPLLDRPQDKLECTDIYPKINRQLSPGHQTSIYSPHPDQMVRRTMEQVRNQRLLSQQSRRRIKSANRWQSQHHLLTTQAVPL